MDDMSPLEAGLLGSFIKLWADHYGCFLENKGGAMPSQHHWFVVTS